MRSFEITEDDWVSYFDEFSRNHAGWPVTIELMSEQVGPQRLAAEMPFQGISFDAEGSRPCTIQVGAGDQPSANVTHVIDMPLHIHVADDDQSEQVTVKIEPARGAATLVHLHKPLFS